MTRTSLISKSRSVAVAAICFTLTACAPGRVHDAVRLLADIAAVDAPSALKSATPRPARMTVHYRRAGRAHVADLYTPGERPEAGLVLVPGLTPQGKDDARVVALATSLARVRFQVLVPDLPRARAIRASAEDAVPIADALLHLSEFMAAQWPGDPPTVGLAAVSYAVGPAMLAALQPAVRNKVAFLFGVGGYYDLVAVITYFTTGAFRRSADDAWQYQTPNVFGRWVFVRGNAHRIKNADDRGALQAMAAHKLKNLDAEIGDLVAGLGPEGRRLYDLLENADPDRVPALIARLSPDMRRDIGALDLRRRDLSSLRARLILVHGRDDSIIPWTESAKLAAAVSDEQVDLYLVDNLAHVALSPGTLDDQVILILAAYRLLSERRR